MSNVSSKKVQIPELDFIRGISFVFVVSFHFWGERVLPIVFGEKISFLGSGIDGNLSSVQEFIPVISANVSNLAFNVVNILFGIGYQGVHAFFLISGFGLTISMLNSSKNNWFDWFIKRFTKIYPPYWIVLVVYFIFDLIFNKGGEISIKSVIRGFITINFLPRTWFMFILLQLYLIFPILYFFLNKFKEKKFLIVAFIVKFLVSISTIYLSIKLYKEVNVACPLNIGIFRSFEFCLGMSAAKYFTENTENFKSTINSWQFIILAIFFEIIGTSLAWFPTKVHLFEVDFPLGISVSDAFIGFGFTGILYTLGRLIMTNKFLLKSFRLLSKYSYESYLVHIFCTIVIINIFSFIKFLYLFQLSPLLVVAISFLLIMLIVVLCLTTGFLVNLSSQYLSRLISSRVRN